MSLAVRLFAGWVALSVVFGVVWALTVGRLPRQFPPPADHEKAR